MAELAKLKVALLSVQSVLFSVLTSIYEDQIIKASLLKISNYIGAFQDIKKW